MFKVNLHELGCDFYAASSHTWLFSPKGFGVFYAFQNRTESEKRTLGIIAIIFGVSNFIEAKTGSWAHPWWLFAIKACCIVGLYVVASKISRKD